MKIQNMFQKDINRDINGVVKVSQSDQHSLEQELSEYIITKELRRHFDTFFENYTKAIDYPTDKIGVWISGFFGSGKSHFLKMLSYLLSNKEVAGRHAFDYFADKFDDPMTFANVQKSVRIPTESILFNIDIEGPINKDKTAVLRVFAKVFYNHCGFYGEDLKIAKLERFIDRQGKTEAFRAAFREINGDDWVNVRDSAAFFEDDVVETLQSVLGMSETAARNWFNGEENADMSIKQLVADIKANIENIAILMIADIHTDKIALRAQIADSLDRLLSQNYIARNGDTYAFLTDEEQDIATDIKNTSVDSAQIVQSISRTVYGEIYPSKKYKYGCYDFPYDQYVDETLNGSASGGMSLRIVTVASDLYGSGDQNLIMKSQVNNEVIVVLSDETPYFDELEQAMKIRKYVKQRNVSHLPESIQRIIRERNEEARKLEDHARSQIEKAIVDGKFYVHGEVLNLKSGSAKDKIDEAMKSLVESVYSKLNMVNQFADTDADVLQPVVLLAVIGERAVDEVIAFEVVVQQQPFRGEMVRAGEPQDFHAGKVEFVHILLELALLVVPEHDAPPVELGQGSGEPLFQIKFNAFD